MRNVIPVLAFFTLFALSSCDPYIEESDITLPAPPAADFTWAYLPDDSNRIALQSGGGEGFIHFWDFGNGQTSTERMDTVYYPQMGAYDVTYSVSNAGGMGTVTKTIDIAETVEAPCEGTLALLTGCADQKTWVFSQEAGAIGVGPEPGSEEYYSSPAGGLVDEQYDDSYQFSESGDFTYDNSGGTVNPFEGYIISALEVPELSYLLTEGTGPQGEDQIVLPSCWFVGTWDSGPVYSITELSEERMVLSGLQQNGDCTAGDIYFNIILVSQ